MLFSNPGIFVPVDLPRRIFRVTAKASNRERMAPIASTGQDNMPNGAQSLVRLRQVAFDADSSAQLLVDAGGVLISATAGARHDFSIRPSEIGKLLQELEVSYRPADLRSAIDRVVADRREVILKDVHHFVSGQARDYEVTLSPLVDEPQALIGIRITFADRTAIRRLESDLHTSHQELETAYEELQSTNEELETTNEELQSTVEELETTNEELQSTNEELETMNEELQTTNEELQSLNDELRTRSVDADTLTTYLQSVFSSLRSAVVVIDSDYRVRVWNRGAEDLWGVRSEEAVGASFLRLDIGLPVAELVEPLRAAITGQPGDLVKTIRSTTRRGKTIDCQVSITPLKTSDGTSCGVILFMDDAANAAISAD
jgi:two-component system, chemotaxis family, CheB/CheR fusion protein